MRPALIVSEELDVERRLLRLFGTRRTDWLQVAALAAGARADASPFDPLSAPGTLAYIYGTRAVRTLLVPKGYEPVREDNIEATYSAPLQVKIVYQNADSASVEGRDPRAISAKGPAGERIVDATEQFLFPEMEAEERRRDQEAFSRAGAPCWFFLVHIDNDDVRAELSLPVTMESGQFKRFVERIFILKPGEWRAMRTGVPDAPQMPDFEISVTRKR